MHFYHPSITHTSILLPLCINNTMANLSFYLLFLTLIGASSLPFLQPISLVDCESEVETGEEEFKAWLDYIRWSEKNQPHFQQLFHRSKNTSTLVVELDGNGNFTSIQKAVDSIPLGNKNPVYIVVNPGVYREKLEIPRSKDFITLQGHGRDSTVVVWNDTAAGVNSTFRSASIAVDAQYFAAVNITFQNSAPAQEPGAEREQAVAMRVSGDNAVFYRCGFLGHQDTLYDQKGEHYFRDCYIEGSIDFVFGNGRSLYQGCELHVVPLTPGSLTAQKRAKNDSDSGFVFLNCSITGSGVVYLGRAWGRYSRVVFLYTYMGDIIMPQGWNNWGDARRNGTVYYGQYMCTGPGAKPFRREPWAHQLTNEEAKPFLTLDFIQGSTWVPLVMPTLTIEREHF